MDIVASDGIITAGKGLFFSDIDISYIPRNYFLSQNKEDIDYLRIFEKDIYEKDIPDITEDVKDLSIYDMLSFMFDIKDNTHNFFIINQKSGEIKKIKKTGNDYTLLFGKDYPQISESFDTYEDGLEINVSKRVVRLRFNDFF